MYGPPRATALAFGRPEPAIAYATPLAVIGIVTAAILMTVFAGDLVIMNGEVAALSISPELLAGLALVALFTTVAHGIGLTAATLVLVARVDGRRLTVRDAWGRALRRPGSVVLAGVVLLLVAAILLVISVLVPVLPVIGIAAGVALLIVGIILAPLLLAWPLVVTHRLPLPAALAWAWRSPRTFLGQMAEPLGSPRFAVVVTVILSGIAGFVVSWSAGLLPVGWWTPVLAVMLALVPASLTQLLLAAVAVRGVALRTEGALEPSAPDSAPASAGRGGVVAGVAVLIAPAVVAGLLVGVNPWSIPAYAAADVHRVWYSSQIVPWQGGSIMLSRLGGEDSAARVCSGEDCGPEHGMVSILPTAVAPAADGGVISASWYPIEGADDRSGSFELRVTHSSPDELSTWSDDLGDDASDDEKHEAWSGFPGEERVLGGIDSTFRPATSVFTRTNQSLMAVAIDSSGDAPVIASIARPSDSRTATVAVDFCSDADCTESRRTTQEVQWANWSSNSTTLDVAATADGDSAVITLTDRGEDDVDEPLRVMTATAGGDWTTEVLDADVPGPAVTDLDQTHGAQVAMDADGLPMIVFRAVDRSTLRVFSCVDASCGDATVTDIEAETELLHPPALAIDSSGRPLIGTIDAAANVALISCDDATCATRSTAPLLAAAPTDGGFYNSFALALDAHDRPLVAVGLRRAGSEAKPTYSGTVVTCTAARCGVG